MADAQTPGTQVAIAETMTAAWLLARARSGVTVADAGEHAAAVSTLPIRVLATLPDFTEVRSVPAATPKRLKRRRSRRSSARHYRMAPATPDPADRLPDLDARSAIFDRDLLEVLDRWGLTSLGDIAQLSRADLHARLGPAGVRLHQVACGDDAAPLVPTATAKRFVERLELEWPIEGLEPLSFVLARLCDALSASLGRADRGAVQVTTRLRLVSRRTHLRVLRLPAPMRDARVLRTLILLDLESHSPDAGIDVVEVEVDVAPGRIVQGSLLMRSVPTSEGRATLLARLTALMGETRVGAPALVDTHDERAVAMALFAPEPRMAAGTADGAELRESPPLALRRFRLPIAARVAVQHGVPARVDPSARGVPGGAVVASAGPWRSSGRWWSLREVACDHPWDRDEWDVELTGGVVYRLARDRATGDWQIEGVVD